MTLEEVESFEEKLGDLTTKMSVLHQVLKDGVRQPTTQEINAAKAAYDALVAEGLELF
jgi:Asp-tRNA(Asn)/Glu-tRNA(Gln) amidotransferase C subunit